MVGYFTLSHRVQPLEVIMKMEPKMREAGWALAVRACRSLGADLPKRIFVRWQSIVERKTYAGWIDISESTRDIMRNSTAQRCHETPQFTANPSAALNLGLAPGGIIQVWVWDDCFRAHKVDRGQVGIEPLGPYLGKNEGRYAWKIKDSSQRYIERFGIPYGSW